MQTSRKGVRWLGAKDPIICLPSDFILPHFVGAGEAEERHPVDDSWVGSSSILVQGHVDFSMAPLVQKGQDA